MSLSSKSVAMRKIQRSQALIFLLFFVVKASLAFHPTLSIHTRGRLSRRIRTKQSNFPFLLQSKPEGSADAEPPLSSTRDALVLEASRALRRVSWLSWWSQVILSTVSAVTLVFARSVLHSSTTTGFKRADGLFLAGTGLVMSFLSILWTWGGARLARRLLRRNMNRIEAANMTRRAVSVGISINLLGMLLSLIGAEQIVGGLAIKVLTMQGFLGNSGNSAIATQTLQPLDILVVQGNTNTLLSHFCSLVAYLYLTGCVRKLDPPSVVGDVRKRKPTFTKP